MKNQALLSLIAVTGIFISSAGYAAQAESTSPPECQLSTVRYSDYSIANYLTIPAGSDSKVCQSILQVPYNIFAAADVNHTILITTRSIDFVGNRIEFGFACGSDANDKHYQLSAKNLGKSIATESYRITCARDVSLFQEK